MKTLRNNIALLACGVALVVVLAVLVVFESDYLYRAQELNLFLYTPLFFKQQLVVAGGVLTWLGTYFTQFFFHPWLGSLLLCLWLGLMLWLVQKAFRLPVHWWPLLLVPCGLVLLTDFSLGYWLYYLKLRGTFFIAAMGTSLAVALLWAYRVIVCGSGKPLWALLFMTLTAVVAYPLAGFYGLLAVALMALLSWRLPLSLLWRIIVSAVAALLIAFVPLIYYRNVYYQAMSDYVWWQALPQFEMEQGFSAHYYPYIALSLFLLLLALLYKNGRFCRPLTNKWTQAATEALLTVLIVAGTWHFWYKDSTFHEEIQMTECVDRQDWEGVLSIMRQHEGEPTRMMVMYKNLAVFKLGRAANELYSYRDGSRKPYTNIELRIAQIGGKNIYLYYGIPNYCYRWCLEDGVEYGWRVEHLKFLVRCSILNGETTVAQKYLDLLKQTRYHGEWAAHYEQLLKGDAKQQHEQLLADAELGPIIPLMDGTSILGSDQSLIELFLLSLQAYRTTTNPLCAELVLLSAMQMKDIPTYWRAFFQYANLTVGKPMPRHFQEAAYLYGHLEKNVDISKMPFDKSVVQSYEGFMKLAQQCRGMSEERMKEVFYPQYGNTFYYNYFLMRNLKSY